MEFSGQASAKELAEVFQMVASSTRPGRLSVASGEQRLSFYFSPEGVTLLSDKGLKSTELAAELVAEKIISPGQASKALADQDRTGGYLGEILFRHGAIDQEAVEPLVLRQIQEEILALCTWERGAFEFVEGELSPEVRDQYRFATNLAFDPQQLLMDAARRLDEWQRVEEHIPDDGAIFVPTSRDRPRPAAATLTSRGPVATAVSVLVDGARTVSEIIEDTHFTRVEVLQTLAQFLEAGLIRPATVEELLDAARALARRKAFRRAARLYSHLANARPGDAVMPLKAGQLYERRHLTEDALAEYQRAVERLLASDMAGQAIGILDGMKALDPDNAFALETSVNVHLAAGDEASRHVAAADARHLAGLLAKRGQEAEAVKFAAILVDLAPKDITARRALADLLVQVGQPGRAADELEAIAARLRGRQPAQLRRVLRQIERLDPGRPSVRGALRALERSPGPSRRRWGRVAAASTVAGLTAAAVTFAVVYEMQGRHAYRAVQQNADDLTRHHRYDEAAALFEEVAREFRYSTVADDALASGRDLEAQGRQHAAQRLSGGVLAAEGACRHVTGAVADFLEYGLARSEAAGDWTRRMLAAAAMHAQARRFESQAKYAEARALYAQLVERYPDFATYWNVQLPLAVESVPAGATVLINGKEVGQTPLLVRHPPFAGHRIVIRQPGFEPYVRTLEPTAHVDLGAELPRRPHWVFQTGGAIESGAACDGQRVFFGSRDGRVYAVAAQTGELVWKFDTGVLGDVTCSPVLAGGMLFVGSHNHHVYGLDTDSGRERWRFRTGRLVRGTPCVIDRRGLVCVGSLDRFVYALSAETGRLRWQFQTEGPVVSTPAAYEDLLLVGSQDRRVYGLEVSDGAVRWRFEAGGAICGSPAVADGVIYFGADDGYLYALDCATGQIRWSFKTGGPVEGSPCVHQSAVYVGSTDGTVYALDVARGILRWTCRTNGSVRGAPAVDGRLLYVGSDDHALYAIDLATGALCWKARTGGALVATPVISGNLLFVGSKDHRLYAFRLPDRETAPATATLGGGRAH